MLIMLPKISFATSLQPVFPPLAISLEGKFSSFFPLHFEKTTHIVYYNMIFWENAQKFQYSIN